MSPVQGRSITGLESESAARTCLIAGPSVKHPREAPERKLSSFGFLRSRSETELADTGRTRTRRARRARMARRGNPVGDLFIHLFIYSFIHSSIRLRWLGKVVIHSPTVMLMHCWSVVGV